MVTACRLPSLASLFLISFLISSTLSPNRSPLNLSLTPSLSLTPPLYRSISHFIAHDLNFSLHFLIPFSSFLSNSLPFSPLRSLLSVSILRLNLSFTCTLSFSLLTAAKNFFNSLPSSASSDSRSYSLITPLQIAFTRSLSLSQLHYLSLSNFLLHIDLNLLHSLSLSSESSLSHSPTSISPAIFPSLILPISTVPCRFEFSPAFSPYQSLLIHLSLVLPSLSSILQPKLIVFLILRFFLTFFPISNSPHAHLLTLSLSCSLFLPLFPHSITFSRSFFFLIHQSIPTFYSSSSLRIPSWTSLFHMSSIPSLVLLFRQSFFSLLNSLPQHHFPLSHSLLLSLSPLIFACNFAFILLISPRSQAFLSDILFFPSRLLLHFILNFTLSLSLSLSLSLLAIVFSFPLPFIYNPFTAFFFHSTFDLSLSLS